MLDSLQDQLRDLEVKNEGNLPRIVILGNKSSGKSELLQTIIGLEIFPQNFATRVPIEIRLENSNEFKVIFKDCEEIVFKNLFDIKLKIRELMEARAGKKCNIIDSPISLTISGQQLPNIIFLGILELQKQNQLELPGLQKIPLSGSDTPENVEEVTKEMTYKYCSIANTIILCVFSGNENILTLDTLQIINKLDPEGNRTYGVITKIDLESNVLPIVQGDIYYLKNGYFGVKLRSFQDKQYKLPIIRSKQIEEEYLKTHAIYSQYLELFGIQKLKEQIQKVYNDQKKIAEYLNLQIQNNIKELKKQIELLQQGQLENARLAEIEKQRLEEQQRKLIKWQQVKKATPNFDKEIQENEIKTQRLKQCFIEEEQVIQENQKSELFYAASKNIRNQIYNQYENNQAKIITISHIKKNIDVENPEVLFYCLTEISAQQGRRLHKTERSVDFSIENVFFSNYANESILSLKIQDSEDLTYKQLQEDSSKKIVFIQDFKNKMSQSLNIEPERVNFFGLKKGIKVIWNVDDYEIEEKDLQKIQNTFGQNSQIKIKKVFKDLGLSPCDFNPKYNMRWKNATFEERGPTNHRYNYYFPVGWKGYGLNIDRYKDNKWILMNGNPEEWRIFFHGTSSSDAIKGITQQGFDLSKGKQQKYLGSTCVLTKNKIKKGIYLTNHIEVAENYSNKIPIGKQQFQIAFQVRAKPSAIRQCKKPSDIIYKRNQKDWDNDYFVIENQSDVRPYRILIKET